MIGQFATKFECHKSTNHCLIITSLLSLLSPLLIPPPFGGIEGGLGRLLIFIENNRTAILCRTRTF